MNETDFSLQQFLGNSVVVEEEKEGQEFDSAEEDDKLVLVTKLRSKSEKTRSNNKISIRNEEVKESFATNFYQEVLPDIKDDQKERRCKSLNSNFKPRMIKVKKHQILPESDKQS